MVKVASETIHLEHIIIIFFILNSSVDELYKKTVEEMMRILPHVGAYSAGDTNGRFLSTHRLHYTFIVNIQTNFFCST